MVFIPKGMIVCGLTGFVGACAMLILTSESPQELSKRQLQSAGVVLQVGVDGSSVVSALLEHGDLDETLASQLLIHPCLYEVRFRDCRIRRGAFPLLGRLSRLDAVEFAGCEMEDDAAFGAFLSSVRLSRIHFSDISLTDDHVRSLDKRGLRFVTLQDCDGLSQDGLDLLVNAPRTKTLDVAGVKADLPFLRSVHDRRPDLELSIAPTDVVELRPLAEARVKCEFGAAFRVVSLRFDSESAPVSAHVLEQFPHLERLAIVGSSIGTELLSSIGCMAKIESIDLQDSIIPPGALAELRHLPRLHELNLDGVTTHDGRNIELPAMPALRSLRVCTPSVCDEQISDLRSDSLEFVSLGPAITERGLRGLAGLTRLGGIALGGKSIGRDEFRALAELNRLTYLLLFDCDVDQKEVGQLADAPSLSVLQLVDTHMTLKSRLALRVTAPKLTVLPPLEHSRL